MQSHADQQGESGSVIFKETNRHFGQVYAPTFTSLLLVDV